MIVSVTRIDGRSVQKFPNDEQKSSDKQRTDVETIAPAIAYRFDGREIISDPTNDTRRTKQSKSRPHISSASRISAPPLGIIILRRIRARP